MKLTFTETGGLLGKTKKAEINFDISEKEYKALLKKIVVSPKKNLIKAKDAFSYFISKENENKKTKISINNIPVEFNPLFDELFNKLKVVI